MSKSSSRASILPPIPNQTESIHSPMSTIRNFQVDSSKIHKTIIVTINNIEKQILNFGDLLMHKQRSSNDEVENFLKFLENELEFEEISCPFHLLNILDRNSGQTNILTPEFYDLKAIGEKLQLIQNLLHEIPLKMDNVFLNELLPYCVSFIEEVGKKEIPVITREYEEIIKDNNIKIKELVERIKCNPLLNNESISIRKYIKNNEQINSYMLEWCKLYLEICSIIKFWADIDRLYPEKLHDTIFWLRNQRQILMKNIQNLRKIQLKLEAKKIDLDKSIKKKFNQFTQANNDLVHYNQRDKNVVTAKAKIEHDIAEMSFIRDSHIKEKEQSSIQKMNKYHEEQIKLYNDSITKAKKRLKQLSSISRDFNHTQSSCIYSSEQINQNLEQDKECFQKINEKLKHLEQEINEILSKTAAIDEQIVIVQNIKLLKLNDLTSHQINLNSPRQKTPKTYRDQTDDFFKLAGPIIGYLWKEIYRKLNFDPPRDWKQLEIDLETIDINNRRLEPDFSKLAYLSLQKWRRLSRQATIKNLIIVLKKFNLAKFVLPEFMNE